MTTLTLRNSIGWSPLRPGFLLIPLVAVACFALSPHAGATCQNGCGTNNNSFLGDNALISNLSGTDNTAIGADALEFNTTGIRNTAVGSQALSAANENGSSNTAIGYSALDSNTTGSNNTAVGNYALYNNTTGSFNTALGDSAGYNLTTGRLNINIGASGVTSESFTIRIGNTQTATFIAGISGTAVTGTAVVVSSTGQLGVASSSERFKDEIKAMGNASETLLSLRPVTFRYKKNIDPKGAPQFGLVAEEVEKVNPDLVVRDAEGKAFTVRYEAVNAMLLNEFLKEHKTVQELKATVAQQKKQIDSLIAGLQRVSDQVELSKPAPQTVLNNH